MCKSYEKWLLPSRFLTDNDGNIYEYSRLPKIQEAIENEKKICLASQFQDETDEHWDDDEIALEFIRKDSREKFANSASERKDAVLNDRRLVYFPIMKNPQASDEMPLNEFHVLNQVKKYESFIVGASEKYNVDPDLIRAIVYMETTHGYYDIPISNLLQMLNLDTGNVANAFHKSILPMNINTAFWGDYFGTREQLLNPQYNIDAGTRHLAQLSRFLKSNDVEKIASLYNNLATHRTNDYGKRVAKFYREKPWLFEYEPYVFQSDEDWKHFCRGLLMTIIEKYPFLLP